MEMEHAANEEKTCLFTSALAWLKGLPKRWMSLVSESAVKVMKLGKDDPRRVTHSLKVGLALSLVSLLYCYRPLYDSFGVTAMWAIMTVVVIFEFSVGAMLCKGVNRAFATLVGGALGVAAHYLSSLFGDSGEPVVIGFCVFIQAAVATFLRFFPKIKARYDYGLVIFILTFSLISVSAVRYDQIYEMAHKRLSTILIGGLVCILISVFVYPVWAGEDLHNQIAANMEKVADFLEAFEGHYSKTSEDGDSSSRDSQSHLLKYKTVINSKSSEESLANFARWEPGHGKFKFHHPWKQYLTIGTHVRECACRIEVLHGQLNSANSHGSPEVEDIVQEECRAMSFESGKALRQLAMAVKSWTKPSSAKQHIENSKTAAKNLKSLFLLNSWKQVELAALMPTIPVATLLTDVVACTEKIAESVDQLSSLAGFKDATSTKSPENSKVQPCDDSTSDADEEKSRSHVIIAIKEEEENGKASVSSIV